MKLFFFIEKKRYFFQTFQSILGSERGGWLEGRSESVELGSCMFVAGKGSICFVWGGAVQPANGQEKIQPTNKVKSKYLTVKPLQTLRRRRTSRKPEPSTGSLIFS